MSVQGIMLSLSRWVVALRCTWVVALHCTRSLPMQHGYCYYRCQLRAYLLLGYLLTNGMEDCAGYHVHLAERCP